MFTTTAAFSEDRISDLLCCAIEGGSNYWYVITGYVYPPGRTAEDYKGRPRHLILPFEEGGALKFRTIENDEINGAKSWLLDRAAMARGLDVMRTKYPRHFANFTAENDDAETGDAFLQCCLFGEGVFG